VLLERTRGTTLARAGQTEEAKAALAEALETAERAHADYEVALTLRAIGRITGEHSLRAQEIFVRLGVDDSALP
jgi:capsid protein